MSEEKEKELLHVKAAIKEIHDLYNIDRASNESTNFMILGDKGSGKTQLISTCRKPVVMHSFDPGGSKTKALQPFIKSGEIIVDNRFEKEETFEPFAWQLWEKAYASMIRLKVFDHIGTYVIDSMTGWAAAGINDIFRQKNIAAKNLRTTSYTFFRMVLDTLVDEMTRMMALPCDILITAHLTYETDEQTGQVHCYPLVSGQSKERLPIVFDEVYRTEVVSKASNNEYRLLTQNDGFYKCGSRLGLDKFEKPNIKALLEKGGKRTEDKPNLLM